MKITKEEARAICRGENVPVMIEGTECILVRKDVFERVRHAIEIEETYSAVIEALGDENPDQYLEYLNEK